MDDIHRELRSLILGPTNWVAQQSVIAGMPEVTFHLNRDHDRLSHFLAYKFVGELSDNFGKRVAPAKIKDACIMISVALEDRHDYLGRDFRYAMLVDENYHELFRDFSVDAIYLQRFDSDEEIKKSR